MSVNNMKQLLIFLFAFIGVAQAQFAPTSAKTAFKNGVSIGTRDSTAYAANDSLVVVINRQGRLMYRSTDGYWKLLANAASSDYVPYTGAVDNVALGNFRITARSVKTDSIYANGSGGMYLLTNSGNPVAHWGSGGSVEVDFKGFAGYDANRASSYTARSFTDKNYVDSSAGLRVRYTDTAAMLAPFVQYSDTTGLYSQVVRTFGTQTIGGAKTFSSDITVNSMRVGLGGGSQTQNVALGLASLNSNTTGTFNTSIGFQSLFDNTTAVNNTAVGSQSLANLTTGSNNIGIGVNAGSISAGAADLTTNTNSIFLGSNTKASANGNTNEIVIGHNLTGNGSNTVTIGNSSVTDNYFSGTTRSTKFAVGSPTDATRAFAASGNANDIALYLEEYGNSATAGPDIFFNRGKGSVLSKSSVVSGDALGGLSFSGLVNSNFNISSSIGFTTSNINNTNNYADADFVISQTYNNTSLNENFRVYANGGNSYIRGSLGIGVTSPLSLLHVKGSSSSAVQSYIHNTNGSTNSASELVFGTWSGAIPTGTSNPGPSAKISAINTNSSDARTDLTFWTYQSTGTLFERVRIASNGDLTAPGVYSATVGGTNRDVFVDNTGLLGYVSSFRASKKNIQPIYSSSWLHNLNPVTFNYRVKDSSGNYTDSAYKELEYGLIAEEVEPINKEMVFYDIDSSGNKKLRGVHYSKLIIPLLAEIQEHKKRLDVQDKIIEALLIRIANLEAKIN